MDLNLILNDGIRQQQQQQQEEEDRKQTMQYNVREQQTQPQQQQQHEQPWQHHQQKHQKQHQQQKHRKQHRNQYQHLPDSLPTLSMLTSSPRFAAPYPSPQVTDWGRNYEGSVFSSPEPDRLLAPLPPPLASSLAAGDDMGHELPGIACLLGEGRSLLQPRPALHNFPLPPPTFRPRHRRHGSTSTTASSLSAESIETGSTTSTAASTAPTATGEDGNRGRVARRSTKQYTTEQKDFILYQNVDKVRSWREVTDLYNAQFPPRKGEPLRRVQGLQAVYYRDNQHIPIVDSSGSICFDHDGQRVMVARKVREQIKHRQRPIGLLVRYPERAITYDWVDEIDRMRIQSRAMRCRAQLEETRAVRAARKASRRKVQQDYDEDDSTLYTGELPEVQ